VVAEAKVTAVAEGLQVSRKDFLRNFFVESFRKDFSSKCEKIIQKSLSCSPVNLLQLL
jgi:hypothetical protein